MVLTRPASPTRGLRILVTGSRGFLGQELWPRLYTVAQEVRALDGDVRQIDTLTDRYDVVCHLAGMTSLRSGQNLVTLFEVNVGGTLAVLRYCHRTGARCVFASSSAVYAPTLQAIPLKESAHLDPPMLYGVSKLMAEQLCRYYAEHYGVSTRILRIFNPYGPHQSEPFVVSYALQRLMAQQPVFLRTPDAARDMVYVTDVAHAFLLASSTAFTGVHIMNLGTGRGLRVRELVERLAGCLGVPARIELTADADTTSSAVIGDGGVARAALSWEAQISLEQGLELTVDAFRSRPAVAPTS